MYATKALFGRQVPTEKKEKKKKKRENQIVN
jgi:hypothetical protein